MCSDHSLELSIFHMNKWMTWRQVKKMNSSSLNISVWSTSHYFFKHCNHDSQYFNDYSIWYLFINYLTTLLMWWRCFDINAVNKLQILRSLVVTTCRLFIWIVFFTSSIFSSFTDIDMSLIFFVDWLWLLERMLSCEWKLCIMTFLITQRFNIVWTASNWDFLTLLTSIQT